ncbi:hypothetical protein [Rhizobium sp. AN80A]|nr:hypothetical protein [Rhizobium sp. AN80A]
MSTDWTALRAELPEDVRERLDEKRRERRLGKAVTDGRKAPGAADC